MNATELSYILNNIKCPPHFLHFEYAFTRNFTVNWIDVMTFSVFCAI